MNDAVHGAMRGVIGALAMTGVRAFAKDLGLIERTPPEELANRPPSGVTKAVPQEYRPAAVRALHLVVGAIGGVGYGALPDAVRNRAWSGPIWGFAIWLSYDAGVAPVLGLRKARPNPLDDATFIADHLLYGFVLSETRRKPRY